MSLATTFQVAVDRAQRRLQPRELRRPEDRGSPARRRAAGSAIGPAVGPHVEGEHLQQPTVGERAVDAFRLVGRVADRVVLEEGPLGPRREQGHALHLVPVVGQDLGGAPVVAHLVVVPEHDLRDLGVEAAHVLVEEVVEVVAPELVERLRDLALGGGDEVAPERTVVETSLGRERLVGVDRVPAVHEEVGRRLPHRLVGDEPALVGIDPPALAHGVGGPGQHTRSRSRQRAPS